VTFEMVEFSCDLGLQNIIFLKEDSLQVVNVVKANGPNWCKYGQLVVDIYKLFFQLGVFGKLGISEK
jgi:hypothetical protein